MKETEEMLLIATDRDLLFSITKDLEDNRKEIIEQIYCQIVFEGGLL